MRTGPFERWAVTGWIAVLTGVATFAGFALHGFSEEGVRSVVRSSAQIAVVTFSLAFAASSLRRVWASDLSAWLLRSRRHVGVGFGIAHVVHLGALVTLGVAFPDPFVSELDALTIGGGGLAYLLLAAMMATSFDRPAAWLGRKRWKRLHTVGSYWLWVIFLQSYVGRVVFLGGFFHLLFALLLVGVFGLRMWARFSSRSGAAAQAQASTG